jgi:hypothetical protein
MMCSCTYVLYVGFEGTGLEEPGRNVVLEQAPREKLVRLCQL